MTLRIVAFAEDDLGAMLARDLLDRVVVERPDRRVTEGGDQTAIDADTSWLTDLWSDPKTRQMQRAWGPVEAGAVGEYTKWTRAKSLAGQRHRSSHGLGLSGYALEAYRAARLAARLEPLPDLVVLCRDTDGRELLRSDLLDGLARARVDLPFLLAAAHQEAESWVVAGYCAANEEEAALLRGLRADHGFDPTLEPHRLTSKRRTDRHDAKRAVDVLLPEGVGSDRGQRCWIETSLDDLERRGSQTGLPEFLRDVTREVLPLLRGVNRRR